MLNWNTIIKKMPGVYLHGQNPAQSGRAISLFYNHDQTWAVYEADSKGNIRDIGHYDAKNLFQKLHELGFEIPLDIQDHNALELPFEH